jgi:hypothetical protein
MKEKNNLLVSVILMLSLNSLSQDSYKTIRLHKNEIILCAPDTWRIKEDAMKFAIYEIKYNVEVKSPKDQSGIFLYVYDSLYGPKMQINDSIVDETRQGMLSDSIRRIIVEESGIKLISGIQIGYLKYTFATKYKHGRAYGLRLFFCNMEKIYFKLDIVGLKRPINEFKKVTEKIFSSLKIDSPN